MTDIVCKGVVDFLKYFVPSQHVSDSNVTWKALKESSLRRLRMRNLKAG
jgi:hypothetical protein